MVTFAQTKLSQPVSDEDIFAGIDSILSQPADPSIAVLSQDQRAQVSHILANMPNMSQIPSFSKENEEVIHRNINLILQNATNISNPALIAENKKAIALIAGQFYQTPLDLMNKESRAMLSSDSSGSQWHHLLLGVLCLKLGNSLWKHASKTLKERGYNWMMHPTVKHQDLILKKFKLLAKKALIHARYEELQKPVEQQKLLKQEVEVFQDSIKQEVVAEHNDKETVKKEPDSGETLKKLKNFFSTIYHVGNKHSCDLLSNGV